MSGLPEGLHLRKFGPQYSLRSGARELRFLALQRLTEGSKLELSTEFFNLFNTPQFDLPNAAIGAGNAGTITSMSARRARFSSV